MRTDLRTDLIWRAAVPVTAVLALLVGAPDVLSGGLVLLGLGLATERLLERREPTGADRVLVGLGGALVVLVLTGIALDVTRLGLRRETWLVTLLLLQSLALVAAAMRGARVPQERPRPERLLAPVLRVLPWAAGAVAVVAVAVNVSAASLSAADQAPLQLSFGTVSGTEVQVVVSSTEATGPLELRTSNDGSEVSYPLISVPEDGSRTTTVPLPRSGRFVVTLSYPDQSEPLRTLVLDR